MRSKSKTSVEILEERDALHARVVELETTLAKVREEVEHALRHRDVDFLTLCRIGAVVRGAVLISPDASESDLPRAPISKIRGTTSDVRVARRVG
jgi:hypothetical protein